MMKDANPGKPQADWKLPAGYKSALAKARDKAKLEKSKVAAITHDHEDSASDDDDSYSQVRGSFAIKAITPFTPAPIAAINRFSDLDHTQEYDPQVLQAINSEYDDKMIDAIASWAHKVHVKPSKSKPKDAATQADTAAARWIEKPTKTDVLKDDVVVIRNEKDLEKSKIAAVRGTARAWPSWRRRSNKLPLPQTNGSSSLTMAVMSTA